MALAEKFLFDFSFDAPGGDVRQRGVVTPAEVGLSRADLAAAVAQARAEGHAAGLAEAAAQRESRIGDALAALAQQLAAMFPAKDEAPRAAEPSTIHLTPPLPANLFPPLLPPPA